MIGQGALPGFTPTIAVPEITLRSSEIIATWMRHGRPSLSMLDRKAQTLEILSMAAKRFTETAPQKPL
jgi:hypothetical protein